MFAVNNCEQKKDNVITFEGIGEKVESVVVRSYMFFSVPSNVMTMSHFCSQLLSANK